MLERIQPIELEQAKLRAEVEAAHQLRIVCAQIVGAAQAAPVIGAALEKSLRECAFSCLEDVRAV